MKAAICTRYGPPEVLQIRDVPRPAPRARQLLVRIHASTVNSSDWFIRSGLPDASWTLRAAMKLALGIRRPRRPILGLVLAGEVAEVGGKVTRFRPGDRVWAFTKLRMGAYAEYTCLDESSTVGLAPTCLTWDESAALVYGGLLGLHVVRRGAVGPGQHVVIYGASGGVGTAAVQLARQVGAQVTGVCGSANAALVRSLGASVVLDYTTVDAPPSDVRYDLFIDCVGKRKTSRLRTACEGVAARLVSVDEGTPELTSADLDALAELACAGAVRAIIDRTFTLDDIAAAHAYVQGEHKAGNVVIRVP